MVAAHELGLADRIELIPTTRETVIADVAADNPLGRIPTLITDAGERVYDSLVIAEYLNDRAGGALFPPGARRWRALTRHSVGQGIIDAVIARFHELKRPPAMQSADALARIEAEVKRAVDALSAAPATDAQPPTIGDIGVAVALAYLDYRFAAFDWRTGRGGLARWHAEFSARPSMRATALPNP